MIIKDLDYKTVISRLKEIGGYIETADGNIRPDKMETGVGILILFQDPENKDEALSIDYPNLDKLLEQKPTDLVVMDFKKGDYQYMALPSVLEKRAQEKGKESELYGPSCRCCN